MEKVNFSHSFSFSPLKMCCSYFSYLSGSKYHSNSCIYFGVRYFHQDYNTVHFDFVLIFCPFFF